MKTALRVLIIIVLLASSVAVGKSIYNQASKFNEIYQAESDARKLAKESEKLNKKLEDEKRSFYLEKQARDKLGFQKPGDVLFVIPESAEKSKEAQEPQKKNWEEWVDVLFR